jgi:alginate O-acetyltransferase complex protein AlgI
MLFNSFIFAIFLPIVFVGYWALQRAPLRWQNLWLLIASYIFYGWWDWRFLCLLAFNSTVDFLIAQQLEKTEQPLQRKLLLALSIAMNLGILGFFKYYNFFIESFVAASAQLGFQANLSTLNIILPAGISFYTFQTMSYTIDVYRRHMQPTRDWIAFFSYLSFFPQLVAGPIERATHLLPQFLNPRTFDSARARDGLRLMLWGLFKKVVIADNLAAAVDDIFTRYEQHSGATLALGTLFFAIQIYCDFSGYSEIAVGSARLFGFDIMRNFAYPYFSRDMGEFWRRWHISLSTWFRDYLYFPLGGSRGVSAVRHLLNLMITFAVSGFWHGANWTYVIWGCLNGLYYLPLVLSNRHKQHTEIVAAGRWFPTLRETLQMAATFGLTLFAWVFFRASSFTHAVDFLTRMATASWSEMEYKRSLSYVVVVLAIEWVQREKQHPLQIEQWPVAVRWLMYYLLLVALFFYGKTGHVPFIYFQF